MPKTETFDRALVIKKAAAVFNSKGFNATSMQDLVDATGINRSSIYNSFDSKLNLFMVCLRQYESENNLLLSKLLMQSKNPKHALELIFDTYIHAMTSDVKGCLIGNCISEMANQDPVITNFLSANQSVTVALFESLIKEGQASGVFNTKDSAQSYAWYLYTAIQGFRMTGILMNDKTELKGISKKIMRILE